MRRVTVAIDPGVTRQGVVVLDAVAEEDNAAATFESGIQYSFFTQGCRVTDLTKEVMLWLSTLDVVGWDSNVHVTLAIETPILNKKAQNPKTYAFQWRNVQCLIDAIPWDVCVEVPNGTAKAALTGDGKADKKAMVDASPFSCEEFGVVNAEALADAYAIGLASRELNTTVYANVRELLACHAGPCVEATF